MTIQLVALEAALDRIAAGELPYEFETSERSFRILGPGCGYGVEYLKRCRVEGRFAETLEGANDAARQRGATVIGAWFSTKSP